ncbi:MAG: ribonuclease H [Dermabacter sp.]|nr:ribonuclease H [Dermabacter sp.]
MTITAAADGSALGNPGPTGWAWYIDNDRWAAGGSAHGTNNIGELTAVLELLTSSARAGLAGEDLVILCDSQYVINSVTKWMPGWKRKGWKKADGKPVLNVELMKALDAAMAGRSVRFEWVKGHAGHPLNEAADSRARAAATAFQRGAAPKQGPGFPGAAAKAPSVPEASAPAPAPSPSAPSQLDLFDQGDPDLSAACTTQLSAADAERALWRPRSSSRGADAAWREGVLHPDALLIDPEGRTLSPAAWARALEAVAASGARVESLTESSAGAPGIRVVDAEITTPTAAYRVSALWVTSGSDPLVRLHRWSETR